VRRHSIEVRTLQYGGLHLILILPDEKERLNFVSDLAKRVNKPASQDAYVYATVASASIQLRTGDYDGARKKLDECELILEGFDSVETVVHASFYRAGAEYYKVRTSPLVLGHGILTVPGQA
jgi:26S proteasome regulatory subunit N9